MPRTASRRPTYAKTTPEQFTATRFYTPKDKARQVNATVAFLASGMDPARLTKAAYDFFHQTLSMSACYNLHGFAFEHLSTPESQVRFLTEVRRRVDSRADLDAERGADMARLFCAEETWNRETGGFEPAGPYADLLDPATHDLA